MLPDLIAIAQEPQFPARHPASICNPFASAKSSSDPDPSHLTTLLERLKVTCSAAALAATGASAAAFFTVAGPKASKRILFSGTPHAFKSSVMLFIIAPGPQI